MPPHFGTRSYTRRDVRAATRQAVRRTLTRTTVRILAVAPSAALALYLFVNRHLTLAELASARLAVLVALAGLGAAGLRYRREMLDAVDRHFFPGQYNARRILDQLPHQIRGAGDLGELTGMVSRAVARAWRLERASFLVVKDGRLADPAKELLPLPLDSQLVSRLEDTRQPLAVELASKSSPLRSLPEAERHWLVDARVHLLAPTFATDHSLNGLIVLAARQSESPFGGEELRRMRGISSAAGLVAEILGLKNGEPRPAAEPEPASDLIGGLSEEILSSNAKAAECLSCGRVYPAGTPMCRKCDLELGKAPVPYALRRMFRFEKRVGIGGMAVVYRALDLKLGRSVAIKTLPRVSPEAAMRLQQEARTAATVSHPGLAAIYGIETWGGTPMLILEYLEGGTLAERLGNGPVAAREVIETGQIVAQALEVIHTFGILHRDIKPSNIGYTRHGAAKLLDFGIARIYQDLRRDTEDPSEILTVDGRMVRESDNVTGTLCYFSPEALDDEPPDPSFDLWSLTVVLYEALTASNLFFRPRLKDMLRAIREAEVPELDSKIRDCPPNLAEFFELELNADKSLRSQNGREYRERLERVRRSLGSESSGGVRPVSPALIQPST